MFNFHPSFEGVELISSFQAAHSYIYILKSSYKSCSCPSCGKSSSRVHSRYTRFVQDLAIQQTSIHLQLQVKKFFCDSSTCSKRIFTERFSWLQSYQRKTNRLQDLLQQIVLSANCMTVSKVTELLGFRTSHDTLLRLLYKLELPAQQTSVHIGIDDFAFKKRNRYGTLIINHDTRRPVMILESRTKENVTEWLKQHPAIQTVSRDGSTSYASAISEALPHAQQVADRWHLLKGLFDALKESLNQHVPREWKKIEYIQTNEPIPIVRKLDAQRELHEERVWKRSQQVQALVQQRKKITWIARHMNNYVITTWNGTPMGTFGVNKVISTIIGKAGLPRISPHGLRHTHAIMMLESRNDIKMVSDRLGHSSLNMTTDVYLHITKKHEQESVLRLESYLKD